MKHTPTQSPVSPTGLFVVEIMTSGLVCHSLLLFWFDLFQEQRFKKNRKKKVWGLKVFCDVTQGRHVKGLCQLANSLFTVFILVASPCTLPGL